MNPYYAAMRAMRVFTDKQNKNRARGEKEFLNLPADLKGSRRYDAEVENVKKRTQQETVRNRKAAFDELKPLFDQMRTNVDKRSTKPEPPWMADKLKVLDDLEHLSVATVKAMANELEGDPVYMQRLQEIAAKHDIKLTFMSAEEMHRAIDIAESNFASYISRYDGDPEHAPTSIRMLEPYFRAEEDLMSMETGNAEKTDKLFWTNIIQIGTPDIVDGDTGRGMKAQRKVSHYFKNLDGLKAYIDKETEGMDVKEKENKITEILSNCPTKYGAAYRNSISPNPTQTDIDINS